MESNDSNVDHHHNSSNKPAGIDVGRMRDGFTRARVSSDECLLDEYIAAYKELFNFFALMGKLFAFASLEISSKIAVLEHHRNSSVGEHYRTAQSMIQYEIKEGIASSGEKGKYASGTRTLLRLHRATNYIFEFFERLSKSHDDDKASDIAYDAYHDTMAKFHPWIVRKAVGLAVYILPSRKSLMDKVCTQKTNEEALQEMAEASQAMRLVYGDLQELYKSTDMINCP